MKNQNSFAQFINSKDNASSLDKCWRKLDGIINDAGVSSLAFLSSRWRSQIFCYSLS
jgi:hypothetical protein